MTGKYETLFGKGNIDGQGCQVGTLKKPETLDLFPSSMREPKIEGLDLYTYVYIYICVWFELNFFYWTSHPKTGLSG